ncbi:hypothetical protein AOZ06_04260 [Kibdelosporangium phytohabitans]|uniref:PD-(D/E)XK endonuclease-like domain-containing protein n=2 Tax=Kibdelosporangium phytohabitans TaxID=860235 RepID=A0A0N9HSU2_9PSEU|nr:hypothetical protein AOZ06_04260 [Kibdelosporangium phytohabitans]
MGALPASGTVDPILLHWSRTHHPVCLDDAQRAVLTTCLDLASFRQPMHRWGETKTVDARRAFFAAMVGEDEYGHDAHLLDAFAHCWTAYLTRGRPRLTALGDRAIIAPELGSGFGIADLVIGNTLVDVKLATQPTTTAVQTWLRQLLGYVLLDHHNALRIDAIAVYSGHNAQLVTYSLPRLLAVASPGTTPDLNALRTDFQQALRTELDNYVAWKERERYR